MRYACISLSSCDNFYQDVEGREGYFKLRYSTAKNHGLYISNYVDERRDILKSANVFCLELNRLFAKTKDWKLAYTLYVTGEDEWEKAKAISKDSSSDYWLISSYLPGLYANEYAKFVAAVYIANYYDNHAIQANPLRIRVEPVPIRKLTTLYQLSSKLGIDYALFKELNPTYKKDIIPNSGRDYFVHLPLSKVNSFYEFGYDAYNYAVEPTYSSTEIKFVEVQTKMYNDSSFVLEQEPSSSTLEVVYFVKINESIQLVADYFDCNESEIMKWNSLSTKNLQANQKLKLHVPSNHASFYRAINFLSDDDRRQVAARD